MDRCASAAVSSAMRISGSGSPGAPRIRRRSLHRVGRWISCDPLGVDSGLNAYEYAQGRPTRLADTNGLDPGDPANTGTKEIWQEGSPPPPTPMPNPSGDWHVDADRIVRRKVENGAGPWIPPKDTKAAGNRLAESTGFDAKTRHLGHEGKAHWQTKAGEVTYVRNEPGRGSGGDQTTGAATSSTQPMAPGSPTGTATTLPTRTSDRPRGAGPWKPAVTCPSPHWATR